MFAPVTVLKIVHATKSVPAIQFALAMATLPAVTIRHVRVIQYALAI